MRGSLSRPPPPNPGRAVAAPLLTSFRPAAYLETEAEHF